MKFLLCDPLSNLAVDEIEQKDANEIDGPACDWDGETLSNGSTIIIIIIIIIEVGEGNVHGHPVDYDADNTDEDDEGQHGHDGWPGKNKSREPNQR